MLRRQPLVVERRGGVLLVGEELVKGRFDRRVAVEDQGEADGGAEVDGVCGALCAALDPTGELVAELRERGEVGVGGDAVMLRCRVERCDRAGCCLGVGCGWHRDE